ncbi:MAG: hypothetical protein ACI85O_000170 [Saprospiraceae bacterium]|jgi:hypothetical protein
MQLRTLLSAVCFFLSIGLIQSQESRNYDGSENNPNHFEWGAVHAQMPRWSPATYADGISTIGGNDRPNPRAVSNAVFAQEDLFDDPRNMSDYCWVWGQFIDHDITLVVDAQDFMYIQVPQGDEFFDPWNTGAALIPMRRSEATPDSGTDVDNPLQYPNEISSFIDASGVYGSNEERADWLRTHSNGKLKTSTGDLLPYNTLNGEYEFIIDADAPGMDDATGQLTKFFVAGDVRANENTVLTSFHTLMVREHNRLCDEIKLEHPVWGDALIYRHARRIVGGLIATITYEEWLPAMGVHLEAYFGYNENINPTISNEFSAAAFRMGHTLLSGTIQRMDMEGDTIPEGNLALKDAFFQPTVIAAGGGLDPIFKGMATQVQQDMDGKVIDDVRNFLFGPAGAGGLDLAAINIARGRERGLADFNTIRTSLGLTAYSDFEDLTNDDELANILANDLGYEIDNLDAWVGMLTENHMPDALFGETVMEIMKNQFANIRDGDRFYFENDDAFTTEEKATIKATKLRDIVMRNTNIPVIQDDIFFAMPHEMLCTAEVAEANLGGLLQTDNGVAIPDIEVAITIEENEDFEEILMSTDVGFVLENAATCSAYTITPSKNTNHKNGVTTADLVAIRRHILSLEPFTTPYQMLAADANGNNSVATSDMVEIRRLILNINQTFTNSTSWKFVDAVYEFPTTLNPWEEDFPQSITTTSLQEELTDANFVAIKVGDVNNTVNPNGFNGSADERTGGEPLVFAIEDAQLNVGEQHTVTFNAKDMVAIEGFQFTLNYNTEHLEFVQINSGVLPDFGAQNYHVMPEAGAITLSWNSDDTFNAQADLFQVTFRAKQSLRLMSEVLTINSRYTQAEAYTRGEEKGIKDIAVLFNSVNGAVLVHNKFELYQNIPNPVADKTTFDFNLPKAGIVTITLTDAAGKTLKVLENNFSKGINTISVSKAEIDAQGVIFYSIESEFGLVTKQMVIL